MINDQVRQSSAVYGVSAGRQTEGGIQCPPPTPLPKLPDLGFMTSSQASQIPMAFLSVLPDQEEVTCGVFASMCPETLEIGIVFHFT
jgi:hypothetical protein